MKFALILPIFALTGTGCGAFTLGPSSSRGVADFLYAIRQVESGDRYDGPAGKAGELGAYQFREMVWRQHTNAPFARARTPFSDIVAVRHYSWLAEQLEAAGVAPTPWTLAAAWNCGVESVCLGRIPGASQDYATRVQNLVQSLSNPHHRAAYPYRIALAGPN